MRLDVFVESGCPSCERALAIARDAGAAFPELGVRIIDASNSADLPTDVFAVPTFALNGEVVSLGNPRPADLHEAIRKLLQTEVD